jgi:hypothetical protein
MTRLRNVAALAALLIFAGCSDSAIDRVLAPSADIIIEANGQTHVIKTPNTQYGDIGFGLIYPSGGKLTVRGHTLTVPAGAVSAPTWFMMYAVETNAVQVTLKAWRAADLRPVTQFTAVQLKLTLDASRVENLDPNGLLIVYLRDGTTTGTLEEVPSTVDTSNRKVTGLLSHSSSYALAREYSPGID